MKILYIGGFNLPDKNAAAQRVVANAKLLRDLGNSVTMVGLGRSNETFDYEGFKCVNLAYPKTYRQWLHYLTAISQYRDYLETSPQLVITYNHPSVSLRKLIKYCHTRKIRIISDCTEWYEPQGGMLFRLIKGWDVNQRMYRVHPKMDGIITISRYLDDFYKSMGMKTLLLPPLVDKEESKWSTNIAPSDEVIRLLYAGSPAGTKDRLDFVIEVLERVAATGKSFCLDIIGITEEQYREMYLNGGKRMIPQFVRFRGRIPHVEVIKELRTVDFQIFLRENHLANKAGFPTKFAETISAGTIVLTNASSNLKDYMLEGVNSFELDISSDDSLFESLMKPLSMSKEELLQLKGKIDSSMFDYRKYIEMTRAFLLSVS